MNTVILTIIGFSVIFIATTLGAALVFCFKKDISERLNAVFLGLSAGIMTAASVWSLLLPSIDGAKEGYGALSFLPAAVGFLAGGLFIVLLDKLTPIACGAVNNSGEVPQALNKPMKLFIAITVHNIPEGLAVGFAFGAAKVVGTAEAFYSALGLAVGIAIQNFPEGAAVSLPLKKATWNNKKAFLFGMSSGAVEPVAAVTGYFLASFLIKAQVWLLAFAAGAMIFVVAEDLIPEAVSGKNPRLGAWGVMLGFAVMMALDVALG